MKQKLVELLENDDLKNAKGFCWEPACYVAVFFGRL